MQKHKNAIFRTHVNEKPTLMQNAIKYNESLSPNRGLPQNKR